MPKMPDDKKRTIREEEISVFHDTVAISMKILE